MYFICFLPETCLWGHDLSWLECGVLQRKDQVTV